VTKWQGVRELKIENGKLGE